MNCLNCKYSKEKEELKMIIRTCNYNPPVVLAGSQMVRLATVFPQVEDADWCGKWEAK